MNYSKLGKEILALSGGKDNVSMVTHCATRLRFEFYDSSKVKGKEIEGLQGVISVVDKGGQYQVIIGNEVQQAYRAIKEELGEGVNPSKEPREGEKKRKKDISPVSSVSSRLLSLLLSLPSSVLV
ncbi:PTS transporter subunit EIIB [Rossellomorea sp. H39__3]